MDEKVRNWIDVSDYDLETADAMLQTKRFLYVGFMCHQAVDKVLKALYEQNINDEPPYTHNLIYLTDLVNIYEDLSEDQKDLLSLLQPLSFHARYPGYKQKLLQGLTPENCQKLINDTKELIKWLKMKLKV